MRRGLSVSFQFGHLSAAEELMSHQSFAKLLKGNWHLIVTEDVSNKGWIPKVYVMILDYIW